jgi:hypothetical protein
MTEAAERVRSLRLALARIARRERQAAGVTEAALAALAGELRRGLEARAAAAHRAACGAAYRSYARNKPAPACGAAERKGTAP